MIIEGEFWEMELTEGEYKEYDIYANNHPYLLSAMETEPILRMFLSHLRNGCNLNEIFRKLNRHSFKIN